MQRVGKMEGEAGEGRHRPQRRQGIAVADRQQGGAGQDDAVGRQPTPALRAFSPVVGGDADRQGEEEDGQEEEHLLGAAAVETAAVNELAIRHPGAKGGKEEEEDRHAELLHPQEHGRQRHQRRHPQRSEESQEDADEEVHLHQLGAIAFPCRRSLGRRDQPGLLPAPGLLDHLHPLLALRIEGDHSALRKRR